MDGPSLAITLDAVIVAVTDDRPRILTVAAADGGVGIPSGPLDPVGDKTLERALRRWIAELTGLHIGYAEQLYTFGDRDRLPSGDPGARWLSVAYLALVREETPAEGAAWRDWYDFFPWEDHRRGRPPVVDDMLLPALREWAPSDPARRQGREARIAESFRREGAWDGIRALERYELLYEARLVDESYVDQEQAPPEGLAGEAMVLDHRRMVAAALGRLRGKLTYRPVVFELLPEQFTLGSLQQTVEALSGVRLHTQNFRRLVERNRLVEGTGDRTTATGGRPAELFRFRRDVLGERPRPGVGVPYR